MLWLMMAAAGWATATVWMVLWLRQRRHVRIAWRVASQAVEERKHAMYRVALMMLRSPDDAQDAVSDALETTWRRILNIRNLDALPTYLMRCTINACHAVLRKRKRETTAEDVSAWLPPALPETPVWMYLGGLPHKYRLPLQLPAAR